jgi:outer membrane receptor protein involved in Fe transport
MYASRSGHFLMQQFFYLLTVFFITTLVTFSKPSFGQALEEIIVTSQKRAESLQDVSVSVTALSGEKLADGAIARLEEVTAFVPNFTLTETGIGTNIYIRGIGSGINQGFEQSVGMYFDGIYYGRAQLARSPIFDLENLEVLKGPQVTLFGNNSIGGAVSLNSAKPTDYFEGSVKLLYSPGHGEKETNVVLSGPINDNLNARIAIRGYDMDGYMFNATRNRDEPNRDYLTIRQSFQFIPDSDAYEVNLKLEHSDFDIKGRQIAIIRDEATNFKGTSDFAVVHQNDFGGNPESNRPTWLDRQAREIKGFGPAPNLSEIFKSAVDYSFLNTASYDDDLIYQGINGQDVAFPYELEKRGSNNDFSQNSVDNITVNVDIPLEKGDLKLITGYLDYSYQDLCDCDFTGADLIEYQSDEQYEQISQEIRYTSGTGDFLDYIVGVYYQKDKLQFNDYVIVLGDSALEETLRFIFKNNPEADIDNLVGVSAPRNFNVDSELIAGFGQATLHFSESTRLMLGLRESLVKKQGYRELTFRQEDLVTPLSDEAYEDVAFVFDAALTVNAHRSQGERTENRTSWAVILEQDINADYMMYFSAVNGFKGGGFDTRSNNPDNVLDFLDKDGNKINDGSVQPDIPTFYSPGTFEFEDEEALAFEVGLKARIADRAEVNIAYFYTDIRNLQLSVFDGGVGFNVSNAGLAVTQGVEIESRISITENWFMNASLAWMQFEYKDYKDGLCTSADLLAMNDDVDLTQPLNCIERESFVPGSTTPLYIPQADLTGETNQYVASYSGSVSLQYENNITDKFLFKGSVDMNFTGDYNPTQNLDPALQQDGYAVYNLRLALLDDVDGKWEVALMGRNITDEKIVSYANDVPLATGLFGTQTSYGFIQRTKSWALQTKYNF